MVDEQKAVKKLTSGLKGKLNTGENVYFSSAAQYVTKATPNGRWVAKVRRNERGRLIKFPVKSYEKASDAVAYCISTRPENRKASGVGQVLVKSAGAVHTVTDLYEYCRKHSWKKLSERRKAEKQSRWKNHLEPYWGAWPLSTIRRSAAQEWVTDAEAALKDGNGLSQLAQCRFDMIGYLDTAIKMDFFEIANPFKDLDSTPPTPRIRVTIESQTFAGVFRALDLLVEEKQVLQWTADMFAIALLTGMREGEILGLRSHCIDTERKAILVNRALARNARSLDESGAVEGEVQAQGLWYPKGGSQVDPKSRYVAIPDQLIPTMRRLQACEGLVFGTEDGKLKQIARFRTAWTTLRKRMSDVAKGKQTRWSAINGVIDTLVHEGFKLEDVWSKVEFRDTRNSFASYAAEVGVPEPTRMAIMGHEGSTVTFRSYTDLTSGAFVDAQERLSKGWQRRQR